MIKINILVTGGAGYVGSILVGYLLEKNNVTVLDNLTYGYNGILPYIGNPKFKFIEGDVQSSRDIKKSLKNIDYVIHLAAIVGYPACKAETKLAKKVNHIGTKRLVEKCKVPIIFASTGSCYGSVDEWCTEESPISPLTDYAITKICAEEEVKKAKNYVIYRFSTGFGHSLRPRFDLLINDFVVSAVKKKELIIFEKDYWRSFIHVKDMARSFIFALENFDEMNRNIYNVGTEKLCLTKEQVALKIKKYVKFYLKFAEFGTDPDKRNYKVCFKKINKLGFKTQYTIDDGIKELVDAAKILTEKETYYNNRIFGKT